MIASGMVDGAPSRPNTCIQKLFLVPNNDHQHSRAGWILPSRHPVSRRNVTSGDALLKTSCLLPVTQFSKACKVKAAAGPTRWRVLRVKGRQLSSMGSIKGSFSKVFRRDGRQVIAFWRTNVAQPQDRPRTDLRHCTPCTGNIRVHRRHPLLISGL